MVLQSTKVIKLSTLVCRLQEVTIIPKGYNKNMESNLPAASCEINLFATMKHL